MEAKFNYKLQNPIASMVCAVLNIFSAVIALVGIGVIIVTLNVGAGFYEVLGGILTLAFSPLLYVAGYVLKATAIYVERKEDGKDFDDLNRFFQTCDKIRVQ